MEIKLSENEKQLMFDAMIFVLSPDACLNDSEDTRSQTIEDYLALIKKLKKHNLIALSSNVSLPEDTEYSEDKNVIKEILKLFPDIKRW